MIWYSWMTFCCSCDFVNLLQTVATCSPPDFFASVQGGLAQAARKIAIAKFRAGKATVLVVTDVAARGIDIPLLDNIINYDFPPQPKLFVHR